MQTCTLDGCNEKAAYHSGDNEKIRLCQTHTAQEIQRMMMLPPKQRSQGGTLLFKQIEADA